MASRKPRRPTRNAAVEAGIKLIEQFYALGTTPKGLMLFSPLLKDKTDLTRTEYTEKARRFADPARGYSASERKRLYSLCREFGFKIGHSHVMTLLRIPDRKKRAAFQQEMIEGGWGLIKLEDQIRKRIGNPNGYAGKRVRTPDDLRDALDSVAQASNHFAKVFQAALRVVAEKQEKKMPGEDLARELCKHIKTITDALIEGDPPPLAVSRKMKDRSKQINSAVRLKDE